jgi:alpha-mannosidase
MKYAMKIARLCLVGGACVQGLFGAEPGDVNVALGKWGTVATASSSFGSGYTPYRAIDGKWAGEHDKWNSAANAAPHWLCLDFGRVRVIGKVVLRHEGVRGLGELYNTGAFRLQKGESPDGPWTDLVPPVRENRENVTTSDFSPTPVRYLRLAITQGEQNGKNEFARIYEVEAYADRNTLDEPLAGFDWVSPAQYRKVGDSVERLGVLELIAAAGASQTRARLEVGGRQVLDLAPGARSGTHTFWVPLQAARPVEAVLQSGSRMLARHAFEPSGSDYFYYGGSVGIVSSSHQDTAWMDTPDFCRNYRVEKIIIPALEMMKKDPNYHFGMECALHLMEFLEAHPERRDEVASRMKEGRLEFGATYNQPYEAWLSGEELVREIYYGRRWIRKNMPGCDARVALSPDVPARTWQMGQILAKSGVPYLYFSRYHTGIYRWLSPDGSGVLAYALACYSPLSSDPAQAAAKIEEWLAVMAPEYRASGLPPVVCMVSEADLSEPIDFTRAISSWNAQPEGIPTLGCSSFSGWFEQIAPAMDRLPTRCGERPSVWAYITGPTHHWMSSLKREAARLLPAAETFTTAACLLKGDFSDWPCKQLDAAWMDEIYIDHGIGGKNGHITDRIFQEKVANARDTGRALLDKALIAIAAQVKPPVAGTPVTVFNTLSWTRTDPVEVTLPETLTGPVHLVDAGGKPVPCQFSNSGIPDEMNVAAAAMGTTATASSAFNPQTGADKAIDGKWAEQNADKWASASGTGPHVITLDFGQSRNINRVVIRHEGCMGVFREETRYNTPDFRLEGAEQADGPWRDLVPPVTGNAASLTSHKFPETRVRFLRLTVTQGTQSGGDNGARIYEIQAFAAVKPAGRKLLFIADDVPALGYKTWSLVDGESKPGKAPTASAEGCENTFYRVSLTPGGIRGIFDKGQNRELLDTTKFLGGEVFTMRTVAENYTGGTDAGEFGAVPMPVMDASFDRVANYKSQWSLLENGPVRTVYGLEQPWKNTVVRQRAVVWHQIKRIDCEVDLKEFNGELWREFRMALPLALDKPTIAYEVPMAVLEIGKDELPTTGGLAYEGLNYFEQCRDIRPREMQNFVDASDTRGGLTLSSDVSVFDWKDPLAPNNAATILQPVLLASRKSCNGEGVWYPQAGDHSYRFAITSHEGGWREGRKPGIAANHELIAVVGGKPAGNPALPTEMSFFSASADNIIISTVKKSEDDNSVVARLYDIEGRDSNVTLKVFKKITKANHTNMIEDDGKPLAVTSGAVDLKVGHHAIETLKFETGR